eukprot:TRINITY_DN79_c0_g1_i11.p1 TRINITY_DN79_c0_g1~~TRINITY_DN79_c0_g1_i11.p1  ORF type:complete len:508 (-),score=29.88 TRINITY_DN79_c0_g1_i11:2-1297(-)
MDLPTISSGIPAIDTYKESEATSGLDIRFIQLPPLVIENQNIHTWASVLIDGYKTHVKDIIHKLVSDSPSVRIAALIIDVVMTSMIDVVNEVGIPVYVYFPICAAFLGFMLYLPTVHETIPLSFEECDSEIELPGMSPMPPLVVPLNVLNKNSGGYTWFLYHCRRFREAKGIIGNTVAALEPVALQALREGKYLPDHPTPPVFSVGPVVAINEKDDAKHACIVWLDEQPPESVVFLSFGSMGSFTEPQIKEMALGVEQSGLRFLWSLRCPPQEGARLPVDANLKEVLPEGFLNRTKERGLVWPSWVPQVAILDHKAIGGFVSHCGWNSIIESLWFGVPILAWPLYSEQRFNRFQLVQDLILAVDLKLDYRGEGLVSAEELQRAMRCLMGDCDEGTKVRARVKEMRSLSRKAVEEGGSSYAFLKQLVDELIL